jgi:hypothetical protein
MWHSREDCLCEMQHLMKLNPPFGRIEPDTEENEVIQLIGTAKSFSFSLPRDYRGKIFHPPAKVSLSLTE